MPVIHTKVRAWSALIYLLISLLNYFVVSSSSSPFSGGNVASTYQVARQRRVFGFLESLCKNLFFSTFWDVSTGGAWLSSARVVRCWVKSRNERNPCFCCTSRSKNTVGDNPKKGGDDVKSACPLCSGRHTCYKG